MHPTPAQAPSGQFPFGPFGRFALALGLLLLAPACGGGADPAAPAITGFTPVSGPAGTAITLRGTGLGALSGATLGDQAIAFDPGDGSTGTLWVDGQLPAGPQALVLTTAEGARLRAPGAFTVTLEPPNVEAVRPAAATEGQAVSILGDDFGLAPSVTVGGVPAVLLDQARSQLSILVPPGAGPGPIAVRRAETGEVGLGPFSLRAGAALAPVVHPPLPPSGGVGTGVLIPVDHLTAVRGVRFGGVPATAFAIEEEGVVRAVVPPGAPPGLITLDLEQGTFTTPVPFLATGTVPGPPVITDLAPAASTLRGPAIRITGRNLAAVRTATLSGVPMVGRPGADGTTFEAWFAWEPGLPPPASGPLVLTSPFGSASRAFTVLPSPPGVVSVLPERGLAGAPVVIRGTGLEGVTAVTLGGIRLEGPALTRGDGFLRLKVPPGAATGPLSLAFAGGSVEALAEFTVAAAPPVAMGIVTGFITQGSASLDGSMPLVAGRDGLLRVFLDATLPNAYQPSVEIQLQNRGTTVLEAVLPAPGPGVPTEPQEGLLADSWNLPVPGALIQPGLTLRVTLRPEPGTPGLSVPRPQWPAPPRKARPLPVVALPPLTVTLVPVQITYGPDGATRTGNLTGPERSLAAWGGKIRQLFPVADLRLEEAPLWVSGVTVTDGTLDLDLFRLAIRLERKRLETPGAAFHYCAGVFPDLGPAATTGMASRGLRGSDRNRSLVCYDKAAEPGSEDLGNGGPTILAHELGHAAGLSHADCGGAAGPDPAFPNRLAQLGQWGLDLATGQLKAPGTYKDFMGYCSPIWISGYNFENLIASQYLDAQAQQAPGAPGRALVVSGELGPASLSLDPLLIIDGAPPPWPAGDSSLVLADANGAVLATLPIALPPFPEDVAPGSTLPFLFKVPLSAQEEAALASVDLIAGGGLSATQVARSAGAAPRAPVAVAWRGGVHVSWDPRVHPEVMARDPRTGAILGTGRDGSLALPGFIPELELLMLDGIRTETRTVRVQP